MSFGSLQAHTFSSLFNLPISALFELFSGASLAPGASCTATVTVAVAGAGTFHNVISASMGQPGAVTNDQAVPALADAIANLQAGIAPVAPVPTLGEAALMAMGLLLGAMGLRRLRPARRS